MTAGTLAAEPLGNTGMEITRVGFGAWAIGGGDWPFGWGPQDDEESVAAIHRAVELGVNWIDTAAGYGFGRSEAIVGRVLRELPASRRPHVFTKAGTLPGSDGEVIRSLEHDSVIREAHASLERLGVDAIDLYQIHWPIPDPEIEEGWGAFAELKEQGLVRHIGVSNFDVAQLLRVQQIAPVESLQPPYSLLDRDVESELLPFAREHGIGVIVYSPMASGLLSGGMTRGRIEGFPDNDWRKRSPRFQEPQLTSNLALTERLRTIGDRHGTTPGAVAVAWALRNPAVDAAIVGFRRPDQVDPILAAAALELTAADLDEIGS